MPKLSMGTGSRVLMCHGRPPLCRGPHDSANDNLELKLRPVDRGIPVLKRCLELCQTWDIPTLLPQVTRALGTAYALSGRVPEALPLLERAASQGRRGGHALYFVHLSHA